MYSNPVSKLKREAPCLTRIGAFNRWSHRHVNDNDYRVYRGVSSSSYVGGVSNSVQQSLSPVFEGVLIVCG